MERKRVLGIDIGLKKTGLAVSDELGISTRSLEDLVPQSRLKDAQEIYAICESLDVGTVLIGCPNLSSAEGESQIAKRALGLAQELEGLDQKRLLKIHLVDESYSSKDATRRLVSSGAGRKKRRAAIHGESARVLIEDYLSRGEQ